MANQTAKTPASATLLVELLTEELPPKALKRLGEEFALKTLDGLTTSRLIDSVVDFKFFATPRRLAVRVPNVRERAVDTEREMQGPSVSAPPQAVEGFAKKCGIPVEALKKQQTPKGEVYVARVTVTGQTLNDVLAGKVEAALKALPVPKLMRWGDGDAQFARPVHGLVMIHGARVVPGQVLGLTSGNQTLGHRFLSGGRITIKNADSYEQILLKTGKVIAEFAVRRSEIVHKLQYLCDDSRVPVASDALYDEIAALVEAPTVHEGTFGAEFLEVPEECLILSMQQHQKYVPLRDKTTGKLSPRFLFVSNVAAKDPREIIRGNERVLRARLSDARFFYDQDRRTRLEARVPRLASVVYHNKLGTQLERVERVSKLAGTIASELKADAKLAGRAALLCKADLLTDMVGEFPELQGTMGRYYALNDGEPKEVADAIEAHYRPRFAGDQLPESLVASALALADKLYAIAGMFAAGQPPTGDKDPFALRRQALGVIRILIEKKLDLRLQFLVDMAIAQLPNNLQVDWLIVLEFLLDRARTYFSDQGFAKQAIEAVIQPFGANSSLFTLPEVVAEASRFITTEEGKILVEANKRITNILKKSGFDVPFGISPEALKQKPNTILFEGIAESEFWIALQKIGSESLAYKRQQNFAQSLRALSQLGQPTKAFFDNVMVNADQPDVRDNRITLLQHARAYMNQVADLSLMAS